MWRKFIFCAILCASLHAKNQDIQIYADNVSKNGDVVDANKNVVLYSQEYLITADKAKYNQKSGIVELFGNVNMMRGKNEISRSDFVRLNLKNKNIKFDTLFMMNKDLEVWLKSATSSSNSEYYESKDLVVSSCNVSDPDWFISSSSAKLNKKSKFLHLYNPVFHIGSVPVFYLPYFGFSTDKTRRSGLLPPEVGYTKKEGIYYKQPLYFAPKDYFDLEFDPQIRSKRGAGVYGALRFTDSAYSKGEISFGIFKDSQKYINQQANQNLNNANQKNRVHNGYGVQYQRDRLIKHLINENLQEGLWVNTTYLNDIEYLNLKTKDDDYNSLVTSKINYFIAGDKNYFGAYAKYHIDTEKIGKENGNKDTLQELPSLQYHKFADTIFMPNLIYSIDAKASHYYRKIGPNATQYELNLPIFLSKSLLDDYLTLSFEQNLYATHIDYFDKLKDSSTDYIENYYKFSLHTDIAKPYENFFHTVELGTQYSLPGFKKGYLGDEFIQSRDGDKYENFLYKDRLKEEISLYLTQFFYDKNGDKFLRHSISQGYYVKDKKYSNLKNSISIYPLKNLSFFNKLEYSYYTNSIQSVQTGIDYTQKYFGANVWHTYKRNSFAQSDSFLKLKANINFPHQYGVFGAVQYDLKQKYSKMWQLGLTHKRKCWNYTLMYQEDTEPVTTTAGVTASRKQGIYFMVNFYPMGGIHYNYSEKRDYNSIIE